MSALNHIRNAITSSSSLGSSNFKRGLPLILRDYERRFSTEPEQPQDPSVDEFLKTPSSGLVYGKLLGTNKHTLKTDIINYLDGCNLTLDDVKVEYNRNYMPLSMMVQFHSPGTFDHAFKVIGKKGRLYKLERAQRSEWDILTPYDGKAVLVQGIPRNAAQDDVDRFLYGLDYDASSIQMFTRQSFPDPIRMAVIRFPSQAQAMSAFIRKNRGFCLNNQISVRVLQ